MLYEKIIDESRRLDIKITDLQGQLQDFPEGKLICASNGKGVKWYRSDGHNPVYLPKKERCLAQQLAYKKYLTLQLNNLLQEKKAIDSYLRQHDSDAYQKEQSFINSPGFKDLLIPTFTTLSEELNDWMKAPYGKNKNYPENLVHKAYSGNYVRSKSEALIDMFLYKNHVPFRYECLLELGEIIIYPDFTIRHPETGELFYWEHFGLMDDSNYVKNACSKLQIYTLNGIIPTINLITTYETKDHPLSMDMVEKIVEYYFL